MPGNVLLKDVSIAISPSRGVEHNTNILVQNGIIRYMGKDQPLWVSPGTEVVDARGFMVSPGLVSAHTHLGLYPIRTMFRGYRLDPWIQNVLRPWESRIGPRESFSSALLALARLASRGVTLVADMHFNMEEVARAVGILGLKANLSVAIMDRGTRGGGDRLLEENISLAERWHGRDGKIRVSMGPCTLRLTNPEIIQKAFKYARLKGLRVQIHVAEVWEDVEYTVEKHGMPPLKYLDSLAGLGEDTIVAHGVWLCRDEMILAAKKGVSIVHSPSSNMLLGSGMAPVWNMVSQGINVALGVDVSPTYDVLREAEVAMGISMMRGEPLTPQLVFRMLTLNGYRALGFLGGDLGEGMPGDLVMWRPRACMAGSPFEHLVYGCLEPVRVYVEGEEVARDGKVLKLPPDELEEHEKFLAERVASIYYEEGYRL